MTTLNAHNSNSDATPQPPMNPTADTATDPELDDLLDLTGASPFESAAGTLVPVRRSQSVYVPFLCDLGDVTVAGAVEEACTYATKLQLYPGDLDTLTSTYREIASWCQRHGIELLRDLIDDVSAEMIRDLADVPDLACKPRADRGRPLSAAYAEAASQRRRVHRIRTITVSLRSAAVLTRHRIHKHRIKVDRMDHGLPVLPSLEDHKGRPLTDEEVLLARYIVEIDLREKAPPRPLLAYLIAQSGIRLIESTALSTHSLDNPEKPTTVTAPGAWGWPERVVELDDHAAATMPVLIARLRPGVQALTYTGEAPGTGKSTASLDGILTRHMRRAGIADPLVTAKSATLWRVQHALNTTGRMADARKYHGGRTANVLADLKLDYDEMDLDLGLIHLRRIDTDELVVTIAEEGFHDRSTTHTRGRDE